jgi:hypothetical protein
VTIGCAVALFGTSACTSSNLPANGQPDDGGGGEAGVLDVYTLPPRDAGPDTVDSAPPYDAGPVVPDTACGDAGGVRATVYSSGAKAGAFNALGTLGSRRVAQSSADQGFVLLDTAGTNASATPTALGTDVNRIATDGTTLGVAGVTLPQVLFQRYDAFGAALGDGGAVVLASDQLQGIAVGQSAGTFLVTWATPNGVYARGIDAIGQPAGPAFALDSTGQANLTASIVADNGGFAVLWAGYASQGGGIVVRTALSKASTTAMTSTHDISALNRARSVIQLVKTPTGYAAILDEPSFAPDPSRIRLLLLDANGAPTIDPPILGGAVRSYGLAAQGAELGVLAQRADGTLAFRPFAANGAPLGSWQCIGAAPQLTKIAALDVDGAGYAAIYGATDGTVMLARFDHLGQ